MEKAHPDVFNLLLQVFEDGQLTDGLGNTVDFKNTILIMTSNIGARHLMKKQGLGFQSDRDDLVSEKIEELVKNEVKKTFNPEFLNRLDEVILFQSLNDADLIQIVELLVQQLNLNLAQKAITISVTDDAKKWILDKTLVDRSYGARPLRRALQRYVEDPLSEALIAGHITARPAFLEVYLDANQLFYRPVSADETGDRRKGGWHSAVQRLTSFTHEKSPRFAGGFFHFISMLRTLRVPVPRGQPAGGQDGLLDRVVVLVRGASPAPHALRVRLPWLPLSHSKDRSGLFHLWTIAGSIGKSVFSQSREFEVWVYEEPF